MHYWICKEIVHLLKKPCWESPIFYWGGEGNNCSHHVTNCHLQFHWLLYWDSVECVNPVINNVAIFFLKVHHLDFPVVILVNIIFYCHNLCLLQKQLQCHYLVENFTNFTFYFYKDIIINKNLLNMVFASQIESLIEVYYANKSFWKKYIYILTKEFSGAPDNSGISMR